MARNKVPNTPAMRALKTAKADFKPRAYTYEERGGTQVAASELGVPEHAIIKTLVMEDDSGAPLIMLMHGDREVSTKNLAREIGTKSVKPCDPATAERHTGYRVGAIATGDALRTSLIKVTDCVQICAPHIGQEAALYGLRHLDGWRTSNR